LIAHAHRSPEFRNFGIGAVLLVVASVAWSITDAQYREEGREQEYERERREAARQEVARQDAERQHQEAERQAAARAAVERQAAERAAASAAQRNAAEREAAAERAAVLSPTDLLISNVTLGSSLSGTDYFGKPFTQDQMDELPILSGTITNHSGQTLRYLEFELTLKDCPLGYGSDACGIVGQNRIQPFVYIPPNQTRTFSEGGLFTNLPHRDQQHRRFFSWRIVTASSCSRDNLSSHQCANKTARE
jgi:hypothetical protein